MIKRAALIIALTMSLASTSKAQWAVFDPAAYLQRLLHYVEQVAQIYEWYTYMETVRRNLSSLDQSVLRDLFPGVGDTISWDQGDYLVQQLTNLNPDSPYFYREVLSLLQQAHRLGDGDELLVDIDTMAHLLQRAPHLRQEIERYRERYRVIYDAHAYKADVNKHAAERRLEMESLASRAQGLTDESTVKALQILIASTNLTTQGIEQVVQSHQQLLSQAQSQELRELAKEHGMYQLQLKQAQLRAENKLLLQSSGNYMDLMDDL